MDTLIERKPGINRKRLYWVGGVMLGLAVIAYFIFRDTASSMAVEKDRLTIATVEQAEFSDYIRVIGQVMPSRIIYMDAIEGGRVEERLKEEGAMVKAGDVILRLSNPLLNIGIMQSEADLAYQENELRNTRISMEQERLQLKQERIGPSSLIRRSEISRIFSSLSLIAGSSKVRKVETISSLVVITA